MSDKTPTTPTNSRYEAAPFTNDEAIDCVHRFVESHFRNDHGSRVTISIPANPERDDDLRILAHVERIGLENESLRTDLARVTAERDIAVQVVADLRMLCVRISRRTKEEDRQEMVGHANRIAAKAGVVPSILREYTEGTPAAASDQPAGSGG